MFNIKKGGDQMNDPIQTPKLKNENATMGMICIWSRLAGADS